MHANEILCYNVTTTLLTHSVYVFIDTSYNYSTRSFIWKFEKDEKLFREFQKIPTVGAWDWTYFSTLSQSGDLFHFLVVANTINSKQEVQLESKIYYWNQLMAGGLGNFEEYNQNIPVCFLTTNRYLKLCNQFVVF